MNRPMNRIVRTLLISAATVLLYTGPLRAQEAASTYKAKCAMCHGADGKGDTPAGKRLGARDFASPEVQKETDEELAEITAKGKNKMPAYEKTLKESQIKDLVAYIRELAKKSK
jgi:cytochrome c6